MPRSKVRERDAGLRVGVRVMAASSLTAVALAGTGGLSLARMHAANEHLIAARAGLVASPRNIATIRQRLQAGYMGQARYFATLATAPATVDLTAQAKAMRDLDSAIDAALVEAQRAAVGGTAAEQLTAIRSAIAEYRAARDRLAFATGTAEQGAGSGSAEQLVAPAVPEEAEQVVAALDGASARVEQLVAEFAAAEQAEVDRRIAVDQDAARRAYRVVIWSVVLTMLVTVPVGLLLVSRVLAPLGRLGLVLGQLAGGDLPESCGIPERGAFGQLARSVDGIAARMRRTGRTVAAGAQMLFQRAEWVLRAGADAAVAGTSGSGSSVGMALAVNDVQATLRQTASATGEVTEAAKLIVERVGNGGRATERAAQVVHAAGETIARLGRSSAEIGAVLQLITSVAEQTNLLAVNATIEAAHAGAAGRGFAIVAGEVKELASQTAGATEQIRRQVAALRGDTQQAAVAIGEVGQVVRLIDSQQGAITEAAGRQVGAAGTVGQGIRQAVEGGSKLAVILRESTVASRPPRAGRPAVARSSTSRAAGSEVSEEYRQTAEVLKQLAIDMREIAEEWHHSGSTQPGQV